MTTADYWTCWVKQCPTVRMSGTKAEIEAWKKFMRTDPSFGRLMEKYTFSWDRGFVPEPEPWGQDEYEAENNKTGTSGYVDDALEGLDFPIIEMSIGDPVDWFDE